MALTAAKGTKLKKADPKEHTTDTKSEKHRSTRRFNGKCNYCHKLGHKKADCFSLKKMENTSKSKEDKIHEEKKQGVTFVCNSGEANLVVDQQDWIADSGASYHMAHDRNAFWSLEEINTEETIGLADNRRLSIKGIGQVKIKTWVNDQWESAIISNVRWIPELGKNLFSFKAVTNHNCKIVTSKHQVEVIRDGRVCATGVWDANLYKMKFKMVWPAQANMTQRISLKLLHEKMGHANVDTLRKMIKNKAVDGIELSEETSFLCEACQYGKQTRRTFKSAIPKETAPGEVVHTDVCGPIEETALNGAKYFMIMKDDATEFRTVATLRNKEEVAHRLMEYCNMIKTKFGSEVKIVKSDNGREYVNGFLHEQFKKRGIIHETTAPHNPEQNGKAEKEIRTLTESARSMLFARNVPKYLWNKAVLTATQVLNRVTTAKGGNKTPYEL